MTSVDSNTLGGVELLSARPPAAFRSTWASALIVACDVGVVALIVWLWAEAPDLAKQTEHLTYTLIATLATVRFASAAVVNRRARWFWARLAFAAGLLTAHHALFLAIPSRWPLLSWMWIADTIAVAGALLVVGWAALDSSRPFLSHGSTRRTTRRCLPLAVLGVLAVPLADDRLFGTTVSPVERLVPAIPTTIAIAATAAIAMSVVRTVGTERPVELRLCVAYAVFLSLNLAAWFVDYNRHWAVAGVAATAIAANGPLHRGADLIGRAVDRRSTVAPVHTGFALTAASPLAVITPVVSASVGSPTAWFTAVIVTVVVVALLTVFFRRLGTGRSPKPLRADARAAAIGKALPAAIIDGELDVHYQPIVALPDRAVLGLEGLLRWQHPQLGHLRPMEIIDAARWCDLLEDLESHVVERVCTERGRHAALAAIETRPAPYFAANCSPETLQREGFAERLLGRLDEPQLQGIVIEIVEHGPIDDWAALRHNVEALRAAGAEIALDDFGTGTSNLQYLSQIDIDIVKIDRSLVLWATAGGGRSTFAHLVELAHNSGARLIAEGIEDAEMEAVVLSAGIGAAQGFRFGAPEPAAL